MAESDQDFVERMRERMDPASLKEDWGRLFALARRGAAMQTLEAHEFDPDPFFPAHCKCGRRFENHMHDLPLPPPPKGAENE